MSPVAASRSNNTSGAKFSLQSNEIPLPLMRQKLAFDRALNLLGCVSGQDSSAVVTSYSRQELDRALYIVTAMFSNDHAQFVAHLGSDPATTRSVSRDLKRLLVEERISGGDVFCSALTCALDGSEALKKVTGKSFGESTPFKLSWWHARYRSHYIDSLHNLSKIKGEDENLVRLKIMGERARKILTAFDNVPCYIQMYSFGALREALYYAAHIVSKNIVRDACKLLGVRSGENFYFVSSRDQILTLDGVKNSTELIEQFQKDPLCEFFIARKHLLDLEKCQATYLKSFEPNGQIEPLTRLRLPSPARDNAIDRAYVLKRQILNEKLEKLTKAIADAEEQFQKWQTSPPEAAHVTSHTASLLAAAFATFSNSHIRNMAWLLGSTLEDAKMRCERYSQEVGPPELRKHIRMLREKHGVNNSLVSTITLTQFMQWCQASVPVNKLSTLPPAQSPSEVVPREDSRPCFIFSDNWPRRTNASQPQLMKGQTLAEVDKVWNSLSQRGSESSFLLKSQRVLANALTSPSSAMDDKIPFEQIDDALFLRVLIECAGDLAKTAMRRGTLLRAVHDQTKRIVKSENVSRLLEYIKEIQPHTSTVFSSSDFPDPSRSTLQNHLKQGGFQMKGDNQQDSWIEEGEETRSRRAAHNINRSTRVLIAAADIANNRGEAPISIADFTAALTWRLLLETEGEWMRILTQIKGDDGSIRKQLGTLAHPSRFGEDLESEYFWKELDYSLVTIDGVALPRTIDMSRIREELRHFNTLIAV